MLLILSLALFPLGLIAILAAAQSAKLNSAQRAEQTLTRLEIKAQRINGALSRGAITIRAASAAIAATSPGSGACQTTLRRLEEGRASAHYALYGPGNVLRCFTPGYVPQPAPRQRGNRGLAVDLAPDAQTLRFTVFGDGGEIEGAGEYSREALAQLTQLPGADTNFDLDLVQGDRRMVVRSDYAGAGPFARTVRGSEPIDGGGLALNMSTKSQPISAIEILMTLLPVMMWLAAGIIAWIVADRLLSRPLRRMQAAVSAYRPGDRQLDLPTLATPAREIEELGRAFNNLTGTVARHEDELEAAIDRQTRLVREVHHRVKNNLQVVASLLNLHSRGAESEDVAAAYASIQRRVDALAVVHRNHYAELEESKGVALKPLVSELGANLRATAPHSASRMPITLNLQALYVTQDIAVSVAFLITELVEFAMLCGADFVAISMERTADNTARLVLASPSLRGDAECDPKLFERFDRIVTGLSRQLRSVMDRDLERGRYSLNVAVAPESADDQ